MRSQSPRSVGTPTGKEDALPPAGDRGCQDSSDATRRRRTKEDGRRKASSKKRRDRKDAGAGAEEEGMQERVLGGEGWAQDEDLFSSTASSSSCSCWGEEDLGRRTKRWRTERGENSERSEMLGLRGSERQMRREMKTCGATGCSRGRRGVHLATPRGRARAKEDSGWWW